MGRGAFNNSGLLSPALSFCGEERENIGSDHAVVVSSPGIQFVRCELASPYGAPVWFSQLNF